MLAWNFMHVRIKKNQYSITDGRHTSSWLYDRTAALIFSCHFTFEFKFLLGAGNKQKIKKNLNL